MSVGVGAGEIRVLDRGRLKFRKLSMSEQDGPLIKVFCTYGRDSVVGIARMKLFPKVEVRINGVSWRETFRNLEITVYKRGSGNRMRREKFRTLT